MKKFFARFLVQLGKLGTRLAEEQIIPSQQQEINIARQEDQEEFLSNVGTVNAKEQQENCKTIEKKTKTKASNSTIIEFDPRDMMELMEVPFLALSKNRTKPIIYESKDGKTKVQVSAHRKHYVASIYDWDIIQLVSGKIQEIINSGDDIPPRTLIIERHKLIKSLRKHDVRKTAKEIEGALNRLRSTLIETTIRNDDSNYQGGFGFLDSWGYTERKDIKEFRITLSDWLYDGICRKGALLKVSQEYFDLTSGLKKFLYRTARKHVGNNNFWEFSVEALYEKSASEQEFKKFKYDLKKAVFDNDIPDYSLEWKENGNKISILFVSKDKKPKKHKKIDKITIKNTVNSVASNLRIKRHYQSDS